MDTSKDKAERLIDAYLSGRATERERQVLEHKYAKALLQREYIDDLEPEEINALRREGFLKAIAAIRETDQKPATRKLWPRIAIAAAVFTAITLSIWLYTFYNSVPGGQVESGKGHRYTNDIAPGKHTATLTTANGLAVQLSDTRTAVIMKEGKAFYNDGSPVQQVSSGFDKTLKISTPRGGTYQVTLSDGTRVWLNAASSLTYQANPDVRGQRSVQLEGEAYFEVAKDKTRPFVVHSRNQLVRVLGTHFNVNSYVNEAETRTSLLEGSVAVTAAGRRYQLKPGQQAVVSTENVEIGAFDTETALAWKNDMFILNNQNLESILRQVERWYNVNVEYRDQALKKQTFDGAVSRFQNISQLLEVLESTGAVHFKLEGRRLIVTR
jgi:ferric-dicitrate binding protein FerR (iron transport regulator)